MNIRFYGQEHEKAFYRLQKEFDISENDRERLSLLYLLTLTEDCRKHILDCYDPKKRSIKADVFQHGWITGADARAIRLAFNLFSGAVPTALREYDKEYNLYDRRGTFAYNGPELIQSTPCNIFDYEELGEYFIEGLKIRFGGFLD